MLSGLTGGCAVLKPQFFMCCHAQNPSLQLTNYMFVMENFDSKFNWSLMQACSFHLVIAVKILKYMQIKMFYLNENIHSDQSLIRYVPNWPITLEIISQRRLAEFNTL